MYVSVGAAVDLVRTKFLVISMGVLTGIDFSRARPIIWFLAGFADGGKAAAIFTGFYIIRERRPRSTGSREGEVAA